MELGLQTAHTVASRITSSSIGAGAFPKIAPAARKPKNVKGRYYYGGQASYQEDYRHVKDVTRGISPLEITL